MISLNSESDIQDIETTWQTKQVFRYTRLNSESDIQDIETYLLLQVRRERS